jgi:membrane dipeptidase
MLGAPIVVEDEVLAFHRRALVIDLHNDLLTKLVLRGGDLGRRHGAQALYNPLAFDIDVPKLREGGVDALGCLLFAGLGMMARKRFWRQLEEFERLFKLFPDDLQPAPTARAIGEAKAAGKIALYLGIEGALAVEDEPAALERLRSAGVRFFGICWKKTNKAGVSSFDKKNPAGLSELGRALVADCNRLGIMVDVSHASKRTFWDLVEASRTPVFSSHSGCEALKAHPRNLDDEQLRAVGKQGGVVGVIFAANFLAGLFASTVETICDHLEHVADVAGEDAVALGSDFDGFVPLPRGMRDVADLPRITQVLWRRGWSEARLAKLLGENFLRYFARFE